MMTDCSLITDFSTKKNIHVLNLYFSCTEVSNQWTICYHNLTDSRMSASDTDLLVTALNLGKMSGLIPTWILTWPFSRHRSIPHMCMRLIGNRRCAVYVFPANSFFSNWREKDEIAAVMVKFVSTIKLHIKLIHRKVFQSYLISVLCYVLSM